jgi:hypothetical protein
MSDPHADDVPPHLDDDTSVGAVTQGGHGTRRGNSLWWIAALVVILVAVAIVWASTRHGDIVGHGARAASLSAPVKGVRAHLG